MAKYKRTSGVQFGPVDVVRYAEAFGASGYMINSPDEIGLRSAKHSKYQVRFSSKSASITVITTFYSKKSTNISSTE